jgi:hypothetical protein
VSVCGQSYSEFTWESDSCGNQVATKNQELAQIYRMQRRSLVLMGETMDVRVHNTEALRLANVLACAVKIEEIRTLHDIGFKPFDIS